MNWPQDVASLGFDLPALIAQRLLVVDYVHVERSEIEETGDYDLDGLFVRLDHAVKSIGAKRVMLDTIEGLFSGFQNEAILRAELRRLFRWLRDHELTTVITGEKGELTLTRHGLEEYVTDAVIQLDHRVHEQVSTRRLRVVKFRGSHHGTNEYPFLIDEDGLSVLPVTSLTLQHVATTERLSSGQPQLDQMLGGGRLLPRQHRAAVGHRRHRQDDVGRPFRRMPPAPAASAACISCSRSRRSRCCATCASTGIDLGPWVDQGLLQFRADRPSRHGLETHLVMMHRAVKEFAPSVVVVDPMTNLLSVGTQIDVRAMLTRHHRLPQDAARHRALHQPDLGRERPRDHRDDDLVADGHLGADLARGAAAAPPSLDLRPEGAGHRPLAGHARVRDHRPRHRHLAGTGTARA